MQPHGKFDTGVDAGRNHTALKIAEPGRPGRSRVRLLAARGLAALLLVAFAGLLALPLQAQAQTSVWSASITTGTLSGLIGVWPTRSPAVGSMTDRNFVYDGTTYTFSHIRVSSGGGLQISMTGAFSQTALNNLTFHTGSSSFALSDATTSDDETLNWNSAGLSWSDGQTIAISFTEIVVSTDATLSDLVLEDNNGTALPLTPIFVTETKSYTESVANSVSSITLTPTVNESNATVEYLNASNAAIIDTDTTTPALDAPLVVGANTFKVKVTAQAGGTNTETYTVVVTRATDTAAPSPQSALVATDGRSVTLNFNENLDIAVQILPAAVVNAFTLTADGV